MTYIHLDKSRLKFTGQYIYVSPHEEHHGYTGTDVFNGDRTLILSWYIIYALGTRFVNLLSK